MKLIIKFTASLLIGYAISRTEKPIHKLERGIAGLDGVSDWYLIMRYVIGTGALAVSQQIMLYDDPTVTAILSNNELELRDKRNALDGIAAKSLLVAAVGVGSGVGLGFLQNSWNELMDGRG